MTDFTRHLIALTGKAGSGKDTAADRFQQVTNLPIHRISFAKKLKQSYAALYDVDVEILEEWKNDPTAVVRLYVGDKLIKEQTHRTGLQRKGTEGGRDIFGYDFWIDQAMGEHDKFIGDASLWLCTDCRFENEAKTIKARGGTIVKIIGPDEETGTHASEVGIPPKYIDHTIDNKNRSDGFRSLDAQLLFLANTLGLAAPSWA